MGRFTDWSEEEKVRFLVRELEGKRPLIPPGMPMTDEAKEVLDTFRVCAELRRHSLGAYVISMAHHVSYIRIVKWLCIIIRNAGGREPQEALAGRLRDLHGAPRK
jgi:phosphoenolpyruvate carboxylase